jgi:hypothetical protein
VCVQVCWRKSEVEAVGSSLLRGLGLQDRLTSRRELERLSAVASRTYSIELTSEELWLLVDGLEAYEYWELGDRLPRNNGEVWIPGDLKPEHDRYWGPEPEPTENQREAIEQVKRCRDLAHRLRQLP